MVKNPSASATDVDLIQEDPTRCTATKPVHHNYFITTTEYGLWYPGATATEACAPQQEKPPARH